MNKGGDRVQRYLLQIPQVAASARENLQLYLQELDRNIDERKATNPMERQQKKAEQEAKELYLALKGLKQIDETDFEYQDFVLDIFKKQKLLDKEVNQYCCLRRVIANSKTEGKAAKKPFRPRDDECTHWNSEDTGNKISIH